MLCTDVNFSFGTFGKVSGQASPIPRARRLAVIASHKCFNAFSFPIDEGPNVVSDAVDAFVSTSEGLEYLRMDIVSMTVCE